MYVFLLFYDMYSILRHLIVAAISALFAFP